MDKSGMQMCRIGQWLGVICSAIGFAMLFAADGATRFVGLAMALFGGWGGFAFYAIPASPHGLKGWQRKVVTPWFEHAIRRDFLAPGVKDSFSTLHAAKRFAIFCFFSCLVLGFFGVEGIVTAFVTGLGAAFVFEWAVRREEMRRDVRGKREE